MSSSGSFTSAADTRSYSLFRGGTPPFIACLHQSGVPISLLGAPNFSRQAEPYNLRLNFTPAAIVYPRTYEDISSVLPCASDSNVKIQARSGGHSYGSYSLGGQNGSLVIDLEAFQQITVDSTTGIAAVGAGVRLGNLALGIYAQGQRALPHGNCPGSVVPDRCPWRAQADLTSASVSEVTLLMEDSALLLESGVFLSTQSSAWMWFCRAVSLSIPMPHQIRIYSLWVFRSWEIPAYADCGRHFAERLKVSESLPPSISRHSPLQAM